MDSLTSTTKELLFNRIEELNEEKNKRYYRIEATQKLIEQNKDKYDAGEYIQFWYLEIELIEKQIEETKKLLFNN